MHRGVHVRVEYLLYVHIYYFFNNQEEVRKSTHLEGWLSIFNQKSSCPHVPAFSFYTLSFCAFLFLNSIERLELLQATRCMCVDVWRCSVMVSLINLTLARRSSVNYQAPVSILSLSNRLSVVFECFSFFFFFLFLFSKFLIRTQCKTCGFMYTYMRFIALPWSEL